jgi:hypothetical protein
MGTLDANGLNLLTNGSVVASFSATGQANFQNSSDSSAAFAVQNAASDSLFTVDTSNNKVILGASSSSPTVLTLGVSGDSSDPTGVDGDIYYNAAVGQFRCHQAGSWSNCSGAGGVGTGDVNNGGNNYGSIMTIGTLDNQPLAFLADGQAVGGFVPGGSFFVISTADNPNALVVQNSLGQPSLSVSTLNESLSLRGGQAIATHKVALNATSTSVYATTPNAASNQITGNIDIDAHIKPDNWCSTGPVIFKANAYGLMISNCKLYFLLSYDGISSQTVASAASIPFSNGQDGWIRATRDATSGAVNFYTGDSSLAAPTSWSTLGSSQSSTPGPIFASTSPVQVAGNYLGGFIGQIYNADVYSGIGGTPVVFFDATRASTSGWSQTIGAITNVWTLSSGSQLIGDTSTFGGRVGIGTASASSLLTVNTPVTNDSLAQAMVSTGAAGNRGLVLQGVDSQTADLLQNQTSGGLALSGFNSLGGLYTNGVTSTLGALVSPTNYCPFFSCPGMSNTGGTLAAGTYYYTVTSIGANGVETVPNRTWTLVATTNTSSASIGWVSVPGAVSYKVYRSTASTFSSPSLLATVPSQGQFTYYTDTGLAATSGAPPAASTGSSLIVQAWDNQSTSPLQVQNSGGTTIGGFDGKGGLFTYGATSNLVGLSSPTITATGYTTLGSLAANTYYYGVTAVNSTGESTLAVAQKSVTTTGSTGSVNLTWAPVPGATSYNVYRSTAATGGPKFGAKSLLGARVAVSGNMS